jgi:DNA-binding transcriptional MocR family regulator
MERELKVDRSGALPLHDQVAAQIRLAIADGEAAPDERPAACHGPRRVLGVNKNTVLRALHALRGGRRRPRQQRNPSANPDRLTVSPPAMPGFVGEFSPAEPDALTADSPGHSSATTIPAVGPRLDNNFRSRPALCRQSHLSPSAEGSHNGQTAGTTAQVIGLVVRMSRHANRPILIEGEPLQVHLSRSRANMSVKKGT